MRRLRRAAALLCLLSLTQSCGKRIPFQPTEESLELVSDLRTADRSRSRQLVHGFHQIEHDAWRWTERQFAVALKTPPGGAQHGGTLAVHLSIPEAIIRRAGSTTLTASLNGRRIGQQTWTASGSALLLADVPADLLTASAVTVDFELSSYIPAGVEEVRELGVIVASLQLKSAQ